MNSYEHYYLTLEIKAASALLRGCANWRRRSNFSRSHKSRDGVTANWRFAMTTKQEIGCFNPG